VLGNEQMQDHAVGLAWSHRDWTERHFDFPGHITGFDPADRHALHAELGCGADSGRADGAAR